MRRINRLKAFSNKLRVLSANGKRCTYNLIHKGYVLCQFIFTAIRNKVKVYTSKLLYNKEMLAYYSVLAIVLAALSAAAYDYRGKKTERTVMDSVTTADPGIAVQMQTDPTFSPETIKPEFILPVQGKIIAEFADREAVWSTTLQLWQTHPALDISASIGEAVVAAADGIVVEAYSDAMYGNIIAVEHKNGMVIRYGSLNTLELIEVGQKVQQGEIISSVGTCIAERELGPHLHIECIKDQSHSDFLLFLQKSDVENLRD